MDRLFWTSCQHWWEQVNSALIEFHLSETSGWHIDKTLVYQSKYLSSVVKFWLMKQCLFLPYVCSHWYEIYAHKKDKWRAECLFAYPFWKATFPHKRSYRMCNNENVCNVHSGRQCQHCVRLWIHTSQTWSGQMETGNPLQTTGTLLNFWPGFTMTGLTCLIDLINSSICWAWNIWFWLHISLSW